MLRFLAIICAFLAFVNIGHGQVVEYYIANMSGANEVPPRTTSHTGRAILAYYPATNTMDIYSRSTIPSLTGSHIHGAAVGVNGGVIFGLSLTNGVPRNYTGVPFTLSLDNLRKQLYYVNFHTTLYTGGEIRGQLLPAPSCGNGTRRMFDCDCDLGYTGMLCERVRTCDPISMNNANFPAGSAWTVVPGSCLPGYMGMPRMTCNPDGTWSNFNGTCVLTCPPVSEFSAQWPPALPGVEVMGSCMPGWRGPAFRKCSVNSTWTNPRVYCQRISCPMVTIMDVTFPSSAVNRTVTGMCPSNTVPNPAPVRYCDINGTWGPQTGSCEAPGSCGSKTEFFADWPQTTAGMEATGTCQMGYSGPTYRRCLNNGTWESTPRVYCLRKSCAGFTEGLITFGNSAALRNITGICLSSTVFFPSPPVRYCDENGNWGPLSGGCTVLRDCPAISVDHANFPPTPGRKEAVATCDLGWRGSPRRRCWANGEWDPVYRYPCVPAPL